MFFVSATIGHSSDKYGRKVLGCILYSYEVVVAIFGVFASVAFDFSDFDCAV